MRLGTAALFAVCIALTFSSLLASAAQSIRVGDAQISEEPLWLMGTPGGMTPNQGKLYDLELTMFSSSADRTKALEAGALDCETINPSGVILLAESGYAEMSAVVAISKEHPGNVTSSYIVRNDSGIKSAADLKGKTIAINGYRNLVELWIRMALLKTGLNPDRDVRFALIPLPAGPDVLRQKLVDMVMVDGPAKSAELRKGGVHVLFTSQDIIPGDRDVNVLICHKDFLKDHGPAVRAFLADYIATLKSYLKDRRRAYGYLAKANLMPPMAANEELPLDYARSLDGRVTPASWHQLQDAMLKAGFIPHGVNIDALVDNSYLPAGR
jgi:ABC-type nitrate/sulfonate/bicarbonate transport system substrate-binding protein